MTRRFCEAIEQDPGFTFQLLEHLGHTTTRTGKLNKAIARIHNDIEVYGDFSLADALTAADIDELTDAEIEYIEDRLNDTD